MVDYYEKTHFSLLMHDIVAMFVALRGLRRGGPNRTKHCGCRI